MLSMNDRWTVVKNKIAGFKEQRKILQSKMANIEKELSVITNSIDFLFCFSEYTRTSVKNKIESIANVALKAVFPDKEIIFKLIANKNKRGLYYVPYVETNGVITPLDDCKGGGVLDIISLCLRISYLRIFKGTLDQVLILDEPFKNIDSERREFAIKWLKQISTQMEIQFIIVTHITPLVDSADKGYLFELRGDKTIVTDIIE